MKKLLFLLFAISLLSFSACSNQGNNTHTLSDAERNQGNNTHTLSDAERAALAQANGIRF